MDPSEILIVDRTQPESKFADSLPAVQTLIDRIGGIHNVHLARLWGAQRCILVEGDDLSFLKTLHDKLYPDAQFPLDDIPNSPIGGWDGWAYAIGQNMMAKNSLGQSVRVYCIFDSDYRVPEEIEKRYEEAKKRQVALHIWKRKEIENYFLNANVIARVVCNRNADLDSGTVRAEVQAKLEEITDQLTDVVFDGFATRFRDLNPAGGVAPANKATRELLGDSLAKPETAMERVSGKELLRLVSSWAHDTYGRGVSLRDILREINVAEIPKEVTSVLGAIEKNKPFSPTT